MDHNSEEQFHVLVVEDERIERLILQKSLIKAGYSVTAVGNGMEGLEHLRKAYFPIVITDWMMPEMDGIELCQALRCEEFPGYVYIFLLTAKQSISDIVKGLEAGADDYLTKPVHSAELIARLNTARRIVSLEHALRKRNEEYALLLIVDPLTKVFNRGYLNERLPTELKRALRYDGVMSIAICDIDHFKKVNDLYGHQVGDQVLREFAERLGSNVRVGIDWIARYGGEEFVIVMPETDLSGARVAAERLLQKISEEPIPTQAGSVWVTASFGVACSNHLERGFEVTADNLIRQADECLYCAKHAGRNMVTCSFQGST